ncbi:hypothetical protein RDI58_023941 [Solanum bulbocastanum]|uniref:Transposase, Ptta/En/Spm, plant n=2 Tax=Solanum bulbocastanum TaxID=147425 RepID=A0AAN8SXB0_SOLBU
MSQSAALKKKGSNPNKAQSPLKNLNFDMQYQSSTELANQFKIKREQLANERNDKAKKEHAPIAHKRKNSEDLIPQQEKSKLLEYKSVIHSSSRAELGTSHMVVGKGQTKKNLFQSGESIQEKGIKLPMHNFRFQTPSNKGVTASVYVSGETLAIHIGDETKTANHKVADDLVDQEEIGGDECAIDEEIGIDCGTKRILESKKVRGKTTCKDIHVRNLEERKEVTFDKGQAVGPTGKIVSELTNFIGTISRNSRFINLMYTSWHAVPKDTKKRMWEYINSKFLIPVEGKKWVMTTLRDAWRRHKQKIKERLFDKNSTIEDMLAKRPDDMPEEQFRQLIEYWKHQTVQAMCEINSRNRKKQKWRHRMGPINFARRATKENDEEPSKSEMFIATRTKTGKDLQTDTQVAIAELQNRQNFGETTDDAFMAVFGKEQPDRLRCYGCVQSNIASPIDASSAQAVKGQNLPHSSGSTHDPFLQKVDIVGLSLSSLVVNQVFP